MSTSLYGTHRFRELKKIIKKHPKKNMETDQGASGSGGGTSTTPSPFVFTPPDGESIEKRILFCRHGQGYHNTLDEQGRSQGHLKDPTLTTQGEAEARAVFSRAPRAEGGSLFEPEVVLVSPLWRTLQTATLAMEARSDGYTCPMIAMEEVREHNNQNGCNHRKPIGEEHRAAFPKVDFDEIDVVGPSPM